jgi:hypothetical protein
MLDINILLVLVANNGNIFNELIFGITNKIVMTSNITNIKKDIILVLVMEVIPLPPKYIAVVKRRILIGNMSTSISRELLTNREDI